jgi:dTMP kinase
LKDIGGDMPTRATVLITFEGPDGSGKTTQFTEAVGYLKTSGFKVLPIREPGGTPAGEAIRTVLLHEANMVAKTELLLFMAARAENYHTVIKNAFGEYDIIISDRSIDSSVAYQGFARGIPVEEIKWLNRFSTSGITPDVTYLMDLETPLAALRMKDDLDRMEQEGLAFQEKVRQGFLQLAREEPERFVVIDGNLPVDECSRAIREDMNRRFSEF